MMAFSRQVTIYDGDEIVSQNDIDVTWRQVRSQRDSDLKESDWRALKDVVLPTAWKEYRQALRDLPQVHAESNDAADNWPVKPDE
jgi:hypothetical protein